MLTIGVSHERARVPIALMKLDGELDAATYLDVIAQTRQLIAAGDTHVLLDLEALSYMGSSGLFAIHSMAMLLTGNEPPDPEGGWGAIHATSHEEAAAAARLKLLAPQPQVDRVLERSGLKRFFATYADRAEALGAF